MNNGGWPGAEQAKNSTASTVAAFTAGMFKQQHLLRPGEWANVMCLAVDRDQAKDILDLIREFFTEIPFLETMVEREAADGFELNNRVRISVQTNSFRAVRGRTILLAILNEVAYWRDDKSARPDEELYRAIKPGLLSLSPHSRLIGLSSPYRKAGLLYKKYKDHFGKNDDVLVLQAGTTTMNPVVSPEEIEREIAKDPAAGIAEYGAQFRDDIGGWLPMEIVEAAVARGVKVRPPYPLHTHRSFVDASGGRNDTMTMSIAHSEDGIAVQDCLIEIKPPLNPYEAVAQIAGTLRQYGLSDTMGDHYGAEWVVSAFAAAGITYHASPRNRSAIYSDALPLFTSGRARILDIPKQTAQFVALERKASLGGKDTINHPAGGHDDMANAGAGALVSAIVGDRRPVLTFG